MSKDLRETLNIHDVTKAIERGSELIYFLLIFLKSQKIKRLIVFSFSPQTFFEEGQVLTVNFSCLMTDTYLLDHTPWKSVYSVSF